MKTKIEKTKGLPEGWVTATYSDGSKVTWCEAFWGKFMDQINPPTIKKGQAKAIWLDVSKFCKDREKDS